MNFSEDEPRFVSIAKSMLSTGLPQTSPVLRNIVKHSTFAILYRRSKRSPCLPHLWSAQGWKKSRQARRPIAMRTPGRRGLLRGNAPHRPLLSHRSVVVQNRDRGDAVIDGRTHGVRELHGESLVRLPLAVHLDRNRDRAAGLAGQERQRAAGGGVVRRRQRGAVGGRVVHGDHSVAALGEGHRHGRRARAAVSLQDGRVRDRENDGLGLVLAHAPLQGHEARHRTDSAVVRGPHVAQLGVIGLDRERFRPHDGVAVCVGREERIDSYVVACVEGHVGTRRPDVHDREVVADPRRVGVLQIDQDVPSGDVFAHDAVERGRVRSGELEVERRRVNLRDVSRDAE